MWNYTGIPAQGSVYHNTEKELSNKFDNFNHDSQNETLPITVRTLPNVVRFSKQGNALSSHQIYQGVRSNILDKKFWDDFEKYLNKSYQKNSVRCRLLYAKKYYHVITDENARDLLVLPHNKKLQVMKALSVLSKYLGCYDRWKEIKERYQLKWSNDNDSMQVFQNLTNQKNNYRSMIKWVKDVCKQIPVHYANILIYCTLTGLRPTEAFHSINLIKSDLDNYLDEEKMILEHVRYTNIFIRKTKKAYISIVNESIIQIATETKEKNSYNSMRCYFRRKMIPFNLNYCRKIFATFLRMQGIEQEVIDLLQGRLPKSIFLRYYYRPDLAIYTKIQKNLEILHDIIITN